MITEPSAVIGGWEVVGLTNTIFELGEQPEIQILACDAKVAEEVNLNFQS